ncbi:beta-lactamase superfamily II metal-dependent hydrolase [Marinobacterium halophilum]|uniref:Beta-lactamase superfamily II metal-dependent hydrolase n=1 Tax=Marinobacterium halophilum TaxID=267374 RepID=A0A2P8F4N6_9GAMM|nr:MBL fold metallo-hydrolase [Marinobacterium halophilum]PSL16656.1 beta-lactamase superfamily II metal-dependent hydrolase [Marinobacterium halophilum]
MGITVRVLEANHGDCILVSHEGASGTVNILIDGGTSATFRHGLRQRYNGALCQALDDIKSKGQYVDLAVLTHIDDDHIHGLIKAFETPGYLCELVKSIWFNSSRLITQYFDAPEIPENNILLTDDSAQTSVRQGKELETLLDEIGCNRAPLIMAGKYYTVGPFTLTVLSPERNQLERLLHKWPSEVEAGATAAHDNDYQLSLEEIWAADEFESDSSVYNGSSIAFLLEVDNTKMLFLGDAHDQIVVENLKELGFSETNKLNLDLVKVSHHGSQYNTSSEFLSILKSSRYVISTNGTRHGLPNKRTIARIIKETDGQIFFNYSEVIKPLLLDHEVESYASRLETLDEDIRL